MNKIKNVSLRQLQIFRAIVKYGNFSAAADKLYLTQPTISMQIKKLSGMIGHPLFKKSGKQLSLTDVGTQLLATCEEIFHSLSDFEMTVNNMMGMTQGHLSISSVSSAEYFIPRILGAFYQRYPGITISIEISNRLNIIERLNNTLDDLYIIGQIIDGNTINADLQQLTENPMVIIAYPEHPLVQAKTISFRQLAEESFILREEGCGTSIFMNTLLRNNALELKSSLRLGSNQAVKQAVMGKLGIAMLSEYAITHDVRRGDLKILNVEGFPIIDHWHVAAPQGAKLSIVAQVFKKFILSEGRQIMQKLLSSKT